MHFAAVFNFDPCPGRVDMVPVYSDVVPRESFTTPNVAFLFAKAFPHLNDIQKTVVFDLQVNHESPIH